ncbi:MAG: glycine cleavage system protein GcvH [Thermosynechococcaceae cyanobacterium]
MSFEYPDTLKYFDSHEYIHLDGDVATVGITAYAVDQLGDIVFVELPEVDEQLTKGETCGNIESVKAVEDLYAPITGKVIECNAAVIDAPETLAEDPYNGGWLLKIQLSDPSELEDALSVDAYRSLVEGH